MIADSTTSVGKYLVQRLEQLGVKHIFGVPGDYVLGFFDLLTESKIEVVGVSNELNAGYAADGYARLAGVGAVCVTYGVGALSLANAVAGAMAERVPLVVVSGGPSLKHRKAGVMLHHTLADKEAMRLIFEPITLASIILTSAEQAPTQIDAALTACVEQQGPVYIELPVDVVGRSCAAPGHFTPKFRQLTNQDCLREAVEAATARIARSRKTVVWAGHEVGRVGAKAALTRLLERTGLPVAASRQSKGMLDEEHLSYIGLYKGNLSLAGPKEIFEAADLVVNLGVWPTNVNTAGFSVDLSPEKAIQAFDNQVQVGSEVFDRVGLADFIEALSANLPVGQGVEEAKRTRASEPVQPVAEKAELTADRLFDLLSSFLTPEHIVVADTGGPMFTSEDMALPSGCGALPQAFYLSIGWSIAAAVGMCLAAPHKRPVVIVGDGAFQMTAQAVSTMLQLKLNPLVIVWNNDGYQVERIIHDGSFNDIPNWLYSEAPRFFGGDGGIKVETEGELQAALDQASAHPRDFLLVEAITKRWDLSKSMQAAHEFFKSRRT